MKTSTSRGRQTVTIQVPRAQVWEYVMDLAKIAEYNPRVARVEPGSGDGRRAAGVSYQCHVVVGGRCTEEDIEIVPMERVVTRMAHDTLGISARLKNYTVETTLTELDACTTKVTMSHFYALPTLRSSASWWRCCSSWRARTSSGGARWPEMPGNQNLQIIGVTNVASSQAMIAIPLPMER
jgi:uncharacterized protein YndB with AHSA1/START domain